MMHAADVTNAADVS